MQLKAPFSPFGFSVVHEAKVTTDFFFWREISVLEEAKEAIFHGLILTHFETYGLVLRERQTGAPVSSAILSGGGELMRIPRCDYLILVVLSL